MVGVKLQYLDFTAYNDNIHKKLHPLKKIKHKKFRCEF